MEYRCVVLMTFEQQQSNFFLGRTISLIGLPEEVELVFYVSIKESVKSTRQYKGRVPSPQLTLSLSDIFYIFKKINAINDEI